MSVTTTSRRASIEEIAAEMDRRGQIIERLETRNDELEKTLRDAERAIAEFYRYHTGGETRGSYDGRPEREGLWKAMRAARSTLAALVPAPQPVGEVRDARLSINGLSLENVRNLLSLYGGEETDMTVEFIKEGHSGPGFYAWCTEYPEDGTDYLGPASEYSTLPASPSPAAQEDGR